MNTTDKYGRYGNRVAPGSFGQSMINAKIQYNDVTIPGSLQSSSGFGNIGNMGLGDTQIAIGPLAPSTSFLDNFVMDAGTLLDTTNSFFQQELIPHVPNWALSLGLAGAVLLWNNSGKRKF